MMGVFAALLFACSPSHGSVDETAPTTFERLSPDPLKHGARISAVLCCSGCHGKDYQGRDWSDEMGVLWTANLTRSAAQHSDAELEAMVRTGRRPDRELHGMPSHIFTQLAAGDLAAVFADIRSKPVGGAVHPDPTFGPQLKRMMADGTYTSSAQDVAAGDAEVPPDLGPDLALGRYIARATCAECHDSSLRGGESPFPGEPARPDLTVMVPAYEPEDFTALMRTGKAAGGREVGLMSEVARNRFSHLTPTEIEAVRGYIVALAKETK